MSDRKAYPNRSAESNRILHLLSRTRSERTKVPTDPGRTIDQTQLAHLRGLGNSTGNLSVLVEAKPFSRLLEQLPLAITRRPIRDVGQLAGPTPMSGGSLAVCLRLSRGEDVFDFASPTLLPHPDATGRCLGLGWINQESSPAVLSE